MIDWNEFERRQPQLAQAGRELLYQFGVGLAFLATTKLDGRPRVHPMCPVITDAGLHAFIVPSPKRADLERDGHFAMHSFPRPMNEDAFYVTGRAETATLDDAQRRALEQTFFEERSWSEAPPGWSEQTIFEFRIDSCLVTRTTGHGDHDPQHTVWHA